MILRYIIAAYDLRGNSLYRLTSPALLTYNERGNNSNQPMHNCIIRRYLILLYLALKAIVYNINNYGNYASAAGSEDLCRF